MRSFLSGAATAMVVKSGTKKIIPLLRITSSPVDRFFSSRCQNDHLDKPTASARRRGAVAPRTSIINIYISMH